ncbi:MAG: DUF3298 domain-containing protein [Brevinema sp.]
MHNLRIFLLLFLVSPLFANIFLSNIQKNQSLLYILDGSINQSPATMFLQIQTNKVSASFYLSNTKKSETFEGEKQSNSLITLTNNEEIIQGSFAPTDDFRGQRIVNNKVSNFDLIIRKSPFPYIEITDYTFVTNLSWNKNTPPDKVKFIFKGQSLHLSNPNKLLGVNKINTLFSQKLNSMLHIVKQDLKNREELDNTLPDCYSCIAYEFHSNYEIEYTDSKVLSLIHTEYIYSGGAHGTTYVSPIVYRLNDGTTLNSSVKDLIISLEDPKLLSLMRQKLLDGRTQNDYFEFDTIRLNNHYYITSSGITFLYNRYEIAAYVYGAITIEFSYEELKPFVKSNSSLIDLFQ